MDEKKGKKAESDKKPKFTWILKIFPSRLRTVV